MNKLITIACLAVSGAANAQTTIDASNKLSWGENIGWMNWRDAGSPAGSQGAEIGPLFLSGYVWCENVGWLNLGDGSPANGSAYGNATGADFGVNAGEGGRLSGLAWGENIGWVNFDTYASQGPFGRHARWDGASRRLRGYAWGENVGWINLDDPDRYVGGSCPVDFNCDGFLDFFDYDDFVATFEGGAPPSCKDSADVNGDGFVDFFDYDDFVAMFEAGC